jgi:hypothetical protein
MPPVPDLPWPKDLFAGSVEEQLRAAGLPTALAYPRTVERLPMLALVRDASPQSFPAWLPLL